MKESKFGPLFEGMVFNDPFGNPVEIAVYIPPNTIPFWNECVWVVGKKASYQPENLKPIAITAEILGDWFGFQFIGTHGYEFGKFTISDLTDIGGLWRVQRTQWGHIVDLCCVHELQRLLAGLGLPHEVKKYE